MTPPQSQRADDVFPFRAQLLFIAVLLSGVVGNG